MSVDLSALVNIWKNIVQDVDYKLFVNNNFYSLNKTYMKIKLLKALPWYEVGHTFNEEKNSCVWFSSYMPEHLIQAGWAEELSEDPKTVWDLEVGDDYIFLSVDWGKMLTGWCGVPVDIARRKYNNCFLTQEDADMELLRRECRAKAWKPDMGQVYWGIRRMGGAFDTIWQDDALDFMYFHNGNVHKTKEDAYEWKAKYGKAFWIV